MTAASEVPLARVEPGRGPSWFLFLPLLALVFAFVLLRRAWNERGPLITVHAADGHGLRPGDALRFRGIEVGSVESVELDERARGVELGVRLQRSALALARAGARFWIVRPELGVEGARGLETLLGARSLAVLPGPETAEPATDFVALEEPPLFELEDEGGLEVVLESEERAGLGRGAPVLYRGIAIGTIVSVGLAADGTRVELRARVRASYAELLRVDSRFWRRKGAAVSLGLSGVALDVESLQSLWLGGVALATPTHPGARASTGQRFTLAAEPEDEWLTWRPALALSSAFLPGEDEVPGRLWSQLSWKDGGWLGRQRSRGGWLLASGGGVLGPVDLLEAPGDARAGGTFLELEGVRLPLLGPPSWSENGLARRTLELSALAGVGRDRLRALTGPEDLLAFGDPALAPVAIAASELTPDGARWEVGARIAFDERWHGAALVARADGKWVGILLVEEGRGRIAPLPLDGP